MAGGPKTIADINLDVMEMNYVYGMILRKNHLLDEDDTNVVTTIIMFATRERLYMNKIVYLRDEGHQWSCRQCILASWPSLDFMYLDNLPSNNANFPKID